MDPYLFISPFEVKNILHSLAEECCKSRREENKECHLLDVGRGNPNFLNTTVREAFDLLSLFSTSLAHSLTKDPDLGYCPQKEGMREKFGAFVKKTEKTPGLEFLKNALAFAIERFSFNEEDFFLEMCESALGASYPTPPRILPFIEKIVKAYLDKVLCLAKKAREDRYLLFATEGATAAMIYIFSSLKMNDLLCEGDQIAIVTPIFSPYLEIPQLQEFQLQEIFIQTTEEDQWQIPESEMEKLKNPKIKALFLVDPTNPTAVALEGKSLDRLVDLVRTERQDLIVLTDTVYAPFVNHFRSLVDEIPENAICIYSYSKYFGVTGWRLGVVMLHEKNVLDRLIANHPENVKKKLHERYRTITLDSAHFPFIERMVADSREEALAHTGGLSTPQQCLMALLSLFDLMDENHVYKKNVHRVLKKRKGILYKNLELTPPKEEGNTFYYAMLDLLSISRKKYGEDFAQYLESKQVMRFFFDLAEKKATICLPGFGFGGPLWSLRISLANCDDEDYAKVGRGIKDLLESYYQEWKEISS